MQKKTSLAHKSIKNSIYNVMGFICPIGLSLLFTPYIVHNLGNDAFGILAIVSMVTGYFAFLNLGLGGAGLKYVSEYYVKKNYDTVNSIINILILIYGILGIIGLSSILALTNLLATKIFKIPTDMINVTKFAFYVSAFGFLIYFIQNVFVSVPKALYRFDIESSIGIIFGSASSLLTVLLIYIGYGLKEIVILRFGIGCATFFVFIIIVKRLLPSYKFRIKFEKEIIKKLFTFGIFDFLTQLANISIYQLSKLFISILLGPAALTYFVVAQRLTERVNGLIYRVSEIVFPIASELSSTKQNERLQYIYIKMFRITLTLKLAIFIPLILFSYKILYYWMGKDFADKGWLVMVFLCGGFFLISLGQIPGLINLGMGKPKNNTIYTLSIIIIMLLTMYPLIKLMTISGAALSFFISGLPVLVYIYLVNKKVMKVKNYTFLKLACIKPLKAGLLNIVLIFMMIKVVSSLGTLLLYFGLSLISYFIVALIFNVFEKDEKKHISDFIKNTLP